MAYIVLIVALVGLLMRQRHFQSGEQSHRSGDLDLAGQHEIIQSVYPLARLADAMPCLERTKPGFTQVHQQG